MATSKGARAVKGELKKVEETGCDIERRSFESMDPDIFKELYLNKKPVILYHYPERQRTDTGAEKDTLQKDWDAEKVKAWLTQMGLSKVAEEAVSVICLACYGDTVYLRMCYTRPKLILGPC